MNTTSRQITPFVLAAVTVVVACLGGLVLSFGTWFEATGRSREAFSGADVTNGAAFWWPLLGIGAIGIAVLTHGRGARRLLSLLAAGAGIAMVIVGIVLTPSYQALTGGDEPMTGRTLTRTIRSQGYGAAGGTVAGTALVGALLAPAARRDSRVGADTGSDQGWTRVPVGPDPTDDL